jgi:hypothetical protein
VATVNGTESCEVIKRDQESQERSSVIKRCQENSRVVTVSGAVSCEVSRPSLLPSSSWIHAMPEWTYTGYGFCDQEGQCVNWQKSPIQ